MSNCRICGRILRLHHHRGRPRQLCRDCLTRSPAERRKKVEEQSQKEQGFRLFYWLKSLGKRSIINTHRRDR